MKAYFGSAGRLASLGFRIAWFISAVGALTGCTSYYITNLGTLVPGKPTAGAVSEAYGINNAGRPGTIAGVFRDENGFSRGVVWQKEDTGEWTATSIGTFSGQPSSATNAVISEARAISEPTGYPGKAWVAGFSSDFISIDGLAPATEWVHGGIFPVRSSQLINLHTIGELFGRNNHALGIARSNSSQRIYVVGWTEKPDGERRAFVTGQLFADCIEELATFHTDGRAARGAQANAINKHREIVGWSVAEDGLPHAVRWWATLDESYPCPPFGFRDIGPSGQRSEALAISADSKIVGYVETPEGKERAVRFATIGSPMLQLQAPADRNSRALGINSAGTIVGWVENTAGHRRAVAWRNGVRIDLTTESREQINWGWGAPGWELHEARGINDAGAIVGVGKRNGEFRAFLLEPQLWPTP
jgi:probable HAF family extracellular repeat protein